MEGNIKFLKRAIKLAEQNVINNQGGPFGAVIVKDGIIISEAVNTVTGSHDPTAHAEINAIRQACEKLNSFQLEGCEIYSSCEPCPMCLGAIYWARPQKLYFAASHLDAADVGFDDSFIYHEIRQPIDLRSIPTQQINLPENTKPFEAWAMLDGKTNY